MRLFVLLDPDGYPYDDMAGKGRVHAYKTYWRAEERMNQLASSGVIGLHVREFSRSQYRYTWEEGFNEGLRRADHPARCGEDSD